MPKAPALIGDLVESLMGRVATVCDVTEPAVGFIELELAARPPTGGWQPGHEIQFRVAPTLARRYSVRDVSADGATIRVLAATDAAGPGTLWMSTLRPGAHVALLAGPHQPLRQHGARRLYLGDGSALGTIDAYVDGGGTSTVVIEAPGESLAGLRARWPDYRFLGRTPRPGDALQAWLEARIHTLDGIDGAVLLGHAQSLQRQRGILTAHQALPRRAITTKPYWATGRQGL